MALTPFVDRVRTAGRKLADAILGFVTVPSGAYIDRTRQAPSFDESNDETRENELRKHLNTLLPAKP